MGARKCGSCRLVQTLTRASLKDNLVIGGSWEGRLFELGHVFSQAYCVMMVHFLLFWVSFTDLKTNPHKNILETEE